MGLAEEPIYQHPSIVEKTSVTIATFDASDYINVHTQDFVCSEGSSSNAFDTSKSTDRTIYLVLSMQDDMKTISYPDRIKNEFDLFIQYGDKKTKGEPVTSEFNEFDAFLGKIGVEDGYVC